MNGLDFKLYPIGYTALIIRCPGGCAITVQEGITVERIDYIVDNHIKHGAPHGKGNSINLW